MLALVQMSRLLRTAHDCDCGFTWIFLSKVVVPVLCRGGGALNSAQSNPVVRVALVPSERAPAVRLFYVCPFEICDFIKKYVLYSFLTATVTALHFCSFG